MLHCVPKFTALRRRACGFTLPELLIVIGIVTALVGLLIPAVGAARRSARQVQCVSNLRQWAVAMQLYATSNEGYLPRRGQGVEAVAQMTRDADWFNALPPLMGMDSYKSLIAQGRLPRSGIWSCAEETESAGRYPFSYAMNMWLSTWSGASADRIGHLGSEATQVFMADGPPGHCSTVPSREAYGAVARHNGRINICFVDGHVGSFAAEFVGCGVGDPKRDDVRWIVTDSTWAGPH